MWHIYIIRCSDASLYVGSTTDIPRRVTEHNSKKGGSYTRVRTPVTLVHQENHPDCTAAQKREAQIKGWTRAKKLALIKYHKAALSKVNVSRD